MNQKFKTLILWALPIILVIALSYQFLSSSNVDSLKSNGTTVAPRNSAVARVSYGRFLDYINSGVKPGKSTLNLCTLLSKSESIVSITAFLPPSKMSTDVTLPDLT